MRISIVIDDGRTTEVEVDAAGAASTSPPTPSSQSALTESAAADDVPPDLAARAAVLGALSGGPAPAAPWQSGAPALPSLQPGEPGTPPIDTTAPGASPDLSAGAAPGADARTPQVTVSPDATGTPPAQGALGTDVDAGPPAAAGTHANDNPDEDGR
jgi:hypothetical protein